MTGRKVEETGVRGEVLVQLRHGVRQSSRLAEQLAADGIVGEEARGLLERLQAIRVELDRMAPPTANERLVSGNRLWSEAANYHQDGPF